MTTEVETKTGETEWWAFEPPIPKEEPTRATIEFAGPKARKAAKHFAEVLEQVAVAAAPDDSRPAWKCVQMQTAGGLRLVTTDGFRLAAAEYIPGLMDADLSRTVHTKGRVSDILARPAMFSSVHVRAIAKVLKRVSPKGEATLEVNRAGEMRTLAAHNDKGESAMAVEQAGNFPNWRKLVPTETAAAPAALNAEYLQWAGRFCEAIDGDGWGIVRVRHLQPDKPARIDARSDDYRGICLIMPMYVNV